MSARTFQYMVCALASALALTAGCTASKLAGGRAAAEPMLAPTAEATGAAAATNAKIVAGGHYLNALVARNNGDYDYAMREMTRAVTADPADPKLRLGLVHLQIRAGKLEDALQQARLLRSAAEGDKGRESRLVASLLVSLRRYEEAADEYVELSKKFPTDEEVMIQLGSLYNRMGRHAAAIEILYRAVMQSPESVIANLFLGRSFALAGEYEKALKYYLRATKLRPSDARILLELGSVYERLERPEDAIAGYRKALEYDPGLVPARKRLGALYVTTRQLDAAIKEFESLTQLEEDPIETQRKIGLISLEKGDYRRAATEFNLVLGANPDDDDVRFYLAATYYQMGDAVSAEREFRRVKPSSARYADARQNLSQLLLDDGRPTEAIAAVEELLGHDPDNRQGLGVLTELYRSQKLYGKALKVARALVDLDSKNEDALFKVAYLQNDLGRLDETVRILQSILKLNPKNAVALNFLGFTYADQGKNLEEAESLIKRALAIHPNDGAFIDSLGWVYYQKGDYESAVGELERANRLIGEDPVVREHLADAYSKIGRVKEALRLYRDAQARTEDGKQKARVLRKLQHLGGRATAAPGI